MYYKPMGIIINDPLEHTKMGISITGCYLRVAEVHIQKTADDKFEVIGMVKIYGDKTARESNREFFTEHSVSVISDGVPSSPYDLVYNELKKQYSNYTDVL
jgi:hypothetical protein